MRVTVLGGEHPDEVEALEAAWSILRNPIPNVKGVLVNLPGIVNGVRVVDANMTHAYNRANLFSINYEEQRAAEILGHLEWDNPDVVVSLHNTQDGRLRYAAIDPRRGVTSEVLGMLREFGVRHLLEVRAGIVAHRTNSVLIEIPKADIRINGVGFVRRLVEDLANRPSLPTATAADFEWFSFRGTAHQDIIHPDELSQEHRDSMRQFGPLPEIILQRLGSSEPLYLTSGFGAPNRGGYWAEFGARIKPPASSHWPGH